MAGREVRYEFFEELMIKLDASKIALAHNANDQAETILMRMMRGTGMDGLIGIRPVRDKIYVRPILHLTRPEIEKYCEMNNINPKIDKSNLETIYARNKVRLELIPYIEENFNKDIIQTLNRLSDIVKNDNDYLEAISTKEYRENCDIGKQSVIMNKSAFVLHEAIVSRIVRCALFDVNHNLYNIEKIHISNIIKLQRRETGKITTLPHNIIAENCYGNIHIYIKTDESIETNIVNNNEYSLKVNEKNIIHSLNKEVEIHIKSKLQLEEVKKSDVVKYFDYDMIHEPITLRYRKDGDRFMPLGMKGNRKLKDLFIDLKIPKAQRNEIPLICFGEDIAWVVGYRTCEKFKISKDTKNILQIRIESEE
jgi:tRNA(Ile)-lysidine synthase